jgi:L-fuculose-phosphate aldolase
MRARKALVTAGRQLATTGLIVAAEGNLSVRLSGDLFLATPAGFAKGELTAGDLVVVDLNGECRGGRFHVSSEWPVHREIYRARPDINAVCHAHPPHASAYACARRLIPTLMPEAVVILGDQVPLVPYATPGSQELADAVAEIAGQCYAFLLANHGAVTCGSDVRQALHRMETLERVAQVAVLAEGIGGGIPLTNQELLKLCL